MMFGGWDIDISDESTRWRRGQLRGEGLEHPKHSIDASVSVEFLVDMLEYENSSLWATSNENNVLIV